MAHTDLVTEPLSVTAIWLIEASAYWTRIFPSAPAERGGGGGGGGGDDDDDDGDDGGGSFEHEMLMRRFGRGAAAGTRRGRGDGAEGARPSGVTLDDATAAFVRFLHEHEHDRAGRPTAAVEPSAPGPAVAAAHPEKRARRRRHEPVSQLSSHQANAIEATQARGADSAADAATPRASGVDPRPRQNARRGGDDGGSLIRGWQSAVGNGGGGGAAGFDIRSWQSAARNP